MTKKQITHKDIREVSHAWAYAGNGEGGKTSNGSYWYCGASLYSYNTAIAKRFTVKLQGAETVICVHNGSKYSVTTTRHQHLARMAFSGKTIHLYNCELGFRFEPYQIMLALHNTFAYAKNELNSAKRESSRTKAFAKFEQLKDTILNLLAAKIIEKKILSKPLLNLLKTEISTDFAEKIKAQGLKEERAKNLAEKKRLKAKEIEIKEEIQEFRNLERSYLSGDARAYLGNVDLVRFQADKERFHTSQGVEIPVEDGLVLYREAKKCREVGKERNSAANFRMAGLYEVDSIDKDGNAKVGCHFFKFEEIERCYDQEYLPTLSNN